MALIQQVKDGKFVDEDMEDEDDMIEFEESFDDEE